MAIQRCTGLMTLGAMVSLRSAAAATLDVGSAHACATVGVTPKCWGYNKWGQLGRGDSQDVGDGPLELGDNLVPLDMGTGEVISEVALGEDFTCALLESGSVKCFGLNTYGQLGQGDNFTRGSVPDQLGDNLTAVDLGTGLTAVAIATGCSHTCAILDDGSVKCFGFNNHGQLGQGTTTNVGDNVGEMGDNLTAVDLGGASATAIAAGCDFTCALVDGSVMCWGRNSWGQLGTGDDQDLLDDAGETLVVVDLAGASVSAIAAGEGHICALLEDATLKCWGHNDNGQLGLGDDVDRGTTPASLGANLPAVELGAGDVPTAVDCGSLFTCVLLDDNSIKCWGDNGHGELGIGSDVTVGLLPTDMGANLTAVDLGDTATSIALGGASACARLSTEGVKCWGQGNTGQLGQGDDDDIGMIEGELAALPEVDLGTDVFATPSPTFAPSSASPGTAPPQTPKPSPTSTPRTPSPLMPTAPSDTPSPTDSATTNDDSGASGHPVRDYFVTGVMFVTGFMVLVL